MTSRRDFIRRAVLMTAAVPVLQNELLAMPSSKSRTGLALYTIRDAMAKDPAAALAGVASAGYDWIEAADHSGGLFYKMKPKEFGKLVRKAGLEQVSSHSGIRPDNYAVMIDEAAEAGFKYIIMPSLPHEWTATTEGFKKAADFFNQCGEKCRKAGIKFGFHNHQIEFAALNGQVPFEILADNSDSKLVVFELDIAWITAAGKDPVEYFMKYPGRFELWHMKDLSPEKQDATLGEGIIDFKPIIARAKQSGMRYWFIEQDNCRTHTPMESIVISRNYYLNELR